MSALENLRKRSGLLVTIIGLAIGAFVLTDLVGGSSLSGQDSTIGEIAGTTIDYTIFNAKAQEALENTKQNTQKRTLTDRETDDVLQQVWNQFINKEVMSKEYDILGISVSDEELYDLMIDHPHQALIRNLSNPQTGQIDPAFTDPATGALSPAKIREFTQGMNPQQEAQWAQLEDYIRQTRVIEKYNSLIKKGIYISSAAAKNSYEAQNTNANIKYIVKKYAAVNDDQVTVEESDLKAYYNEHQNDYKQQKSRKIEYVAFSITPSEEDREAAAMEISRITEIFKANKVSQDSLFVIAESDNRILDESYHTAGTLSPQIDSAMFQAETGTVVGPYEENGSFKVSKLIDIKTAADSAEVRHILIAYAGSGASADANRTKVQAKTTADSLTALLKNGASFIAFVNKYSDDGGKNLPPNKLPGDDYTGKGGNYGWLNANSQFVEPFKNAGLDNKKGSIVIAESQFGYHIVEVLNAKGSEKKVKVATIERKLEPSSKTMQAIFLKASKFAGKNTTESLFQKAVVEEKLSKRVADNIKENDKTIAGIKSARTLIRWVYENEKGTVSEPKEFGSKYVVAVITDTKEKGFADLDQVRDEVTANVIKLKKAELLSEEMSAAIAGGATLSSAAAKLGLEEQQASNINFYTNSIPGAGNEASIIGAIATLKANTLSKALKGKDGVFLVLKENATEAPILPNYKSQQIAEASQMQPRVDYEVYDALKNNANIIEHIVKFY